MSQYTERRKSILINKYGLTSDDIWVKSQDSFDIILVKRTGIDKIALKQGIVFGKPEIITTPYGDSINATAIIPVGLIGVGNPVHSVASANPDNCKITTRYPEMALKRAKHRGVLEYENLYSLNIYGEEESDSWNDLPEVSSDEFIDSALKEYDESNKRSKRVSKKDTIPKQKNISKRKR